jgi:hypothetical protein
MKLQVDVYVTSADENIEAWLCSFSKKEGLTICT